MSDTKAHKHHIVPLKVYLAIGAALFILTGVTVGVSFIDLGGWNVVVALLVAGVKASLVALVFMHLLYDRKIMLVVFITSILFLSIFIIFTMFDTMTRGQIYEESASPIKEDAIIYDSLGDPATSRSDDSEKSIDVDQGNH